MSLILVRKQHLQRASQDSELAWVHLLFDVSTLADDAMRDFYVLPILGSFHAGIAPGPRT